MHQLHEFMQFKMQLLMTLMFLVPSFYPTFNIYSRQNIHDPKRKCMHNFQHENSTCASLFQPNILGILLMNSCNTDTFFSNYYHWQSVRFGFMYLLCGYVKKRRVAFQFRNILKLQLTFSMYLCKDQTFQALKERVEFV